MMMVREMSAVRGTGKRGRNDAMCDSHTRHTAKIFLSDSCAAAAVAKKISVIVFASDIDREDEDKKGCKGMESAGDGEGERDGKKRRRRGRRGKDATDQKGRKRGNKFCSLQKSCSHSLRLLLLLLFPHLSLRFIPASSI